MTMSATLAAVERCRQRAALGMPVTQLGLGQSPFPIPDSVVEALRAAATEKEYLPVRGLSALREEVAAYHRRRHAITRTGSDVIIGPGSKELMFLLQIAFAGELLVPTPAWVSYVPQARIAGRSVRHVPTTFENGYRLSAAQLDEACRSEPDRPRILILNYPANPTGLSYVEDELAELAEVARRRDIVVLSDEIYGELHHEGRHVSIAQFLEEATIVSSGLSKWCGAGGWRLGTFSFPTRLRWLLDALAVLASETYSATCAPVQHAAVRAFRGGSDIEGYLGRARRVLAALSEVVYARLVAAGADVNTPDGAFYVFPGFASRADALARREIFDDRALAERLFAEKGVATLPGSCFGVDPSALRLRLALVDFDGARTLEAAVSEPVDAAFVERHCAATLRGIDELADFVVGS